MDLLPRSQVTWVYLRHAMEISPNVSARSWGTMSDGKKARDPDSPLTRESIGKKTVKARCRKNKGCGC